MVVGFGKDGRVSGVTSYHHLNTMEKKRSECPSYQRFCWSPPPTPLDRMPVHHMVTHQQSNKIPWHFAGTHLYSKGGGGKQILVGINSPLIYLFFLCHQHVRKSEWYMAHEGSSPVFWHSSADQMSHQVWEVTLANNTCRHIHHPEINRKWSAWEIFLVWAKIF